MNANDLLLITLENQLKIEDVLKWCEDEAKKGRCEFPLIRYVSTELISELGRLGFRVQKKQSPIGETVYIVSWS